MIKGTELKVNVVIISLGMIALCAALAIMGEIGMVGIIIGILSATLKSLISGGKGD